MSMVCGFPHYVHYLYRGVALPVSYYYYFFLALSRITWGAKRCMSSIYMWYGLIRLFVSGSGWSGVLLSNPPIVS